MSVLTLAQVTERALNPALEILPPSLDTKEARVLLLTIGDQESNYEHRRQLVGKPPRPTGPAKSFWQGERGGGMVQGVRTHKHTKKLAEVVYADRGVPAENQAIWDTIEHDDVLAAALARLLLYSDPFVLPKLGDEEAAWQYYLRTWRPGAYTNGTPEQRADLRSKWGRKYQKALKYVNG